MPTSLLGRDNNWLFKLCVMAMGAQSVSTSSPLPGERIPDGQGSGVERADIERVVGQIQQQLQILRAEHVAIAKKIWLIKNTIAGLAEVFGPGVVGADLQSMLTPALVRRRRSRGLTDACREALQEDSEAQTLKQISGRIQERYPTLLSHYRYPMAIIQIMLRRLVMYGEAEEVGGTAGLRSWKLSSQRTGEPIKSSISTEITGQARIF
jgi:hypothetical protein